LTKQQKWFYQQPHVYGKLCGDGDASEQKLKKQMVVAKVLTNNVVTVPYFP